MDGWSDGWTDGPTDVHVEWNGERESGKTEEWMDGRMMDGRTDGCTCRVEWG